jgi:hypothetical protein
LLQIREISKLSKGTVPAVLLTIIKTGIFGQSELFDPKLMQLNFDPGVENRFFLWKYLRILLIRNGQKDELGTPCPELVLSTIPNIREYLFTKIRFSAPALIISALLPLAGKICVS